MYLVLSVFLALDIVIMTSWSLINPFYRDVEYFPREKSSDVTDRDVELLPQLEHCHSHNLFIWYGAYRPNSTCVDLSSILFHDLSRHPSLAHVSHSHHGVRSVTTAHTVALLSSVTVETSRVSVYHTHVPGRTHRQSQS